MERIELWAGTLCLEAGRLGEAGLVVHDPRPVDELAQPACRAKDGLAVGDGGASIPVAARAPASDAAGPWFVRPESGTVVAYDLGASRLEPVVLPPGRALPLSGGLAVVRRPAPSGERATGAPGEPPTARAVRGRLPSLGVHLVVGDPVRGRARPVDRPLRVGRDSRCEVRLDDPHASRLHLLVEPAGAAVRVRDLGSENGTFCDGRRVHVAELQPGQAMTVGRTTLHLVGPSGDDELVGTSPAFVRARHAVDRLATTPFPVLLVGETGVGKEALARRVHTRSARAAGPFVPYNAACLSPELADSQLFGHVRGAFTGAVTDHEGAFEQAHGGTLFLDELGELPLAVQARLLRVLEDGVVRGVGATRARPVDVRIVAATHRDLRALVAAGRFRADLYHRLALAPVHVPPVRARRADLPALCAAVLRRHRDVLGVRVIDDEALTYLARHAFPGNVRELRNVLVRAALHCPDPVLGRRAVAEALESADPACDDTPADGAAARAAVEAAGGNVTRAARQLGVPRSTLRDLLRRGGPLT